MDSPDTPTRQRPDTGAIVIGLIILAMGATLLVDRLSPGTEIMRAWWPFILIVMGAARMVDTAPPRTRRHGRSRNGVWLILVGLWGVVNEWHLFGLTFATSWPLLVMASGAMIVWRSIEARSDATPGREP